jgi:hypothetical protein
MYRWDNVGHSPPLVSSTTNSWDPQIKRNPTLWSFYEFQLGQSFFSKKRNDFSDVSRWHHHAPEASSIGAMARHHITRARGLGVALWSRDHHEPKLSLDDPMVFCLAKPVIIHQ